MHNANFRDNVLQGYRLVTVDLDDAPSFDALSYCWGDMRLCTGILFDTGIGLDLVERMFRVTEDLATCLVSILRTQSLEDKPKYLWIDQVSTLPRTTCELYLNAELTITRFVSTRKMYQSAIGKCHL